MRISYLPLSLCVLILSIGCQPTETSDSADYGRFEGDVIVSWDDDGRNMTLRDDFVYVDSEDRRWTAPAGSVVNGASIPAAFWTFIGGPFEGKYRNASVVHDVGCDEMTATWEDVHRMFYEACRCGGVDESNAKMLYYAVYHFGPRWQEVAETRTEMRENADGEMVPEEVTVKCMVRIDPPPPTVEEVEQVAALILEENPEPSVIERTDRETLRRRPRRSPGHKRMHDPSGNPLPLRKVDRTAQKRLKDAIKNSGGNRTEGVAGQPDRKVKKPPKDAPGHKSSGGNRTEGIAGPRQPDRTVLKRPEGAVGHHSSGGNRTEGIARPRQPDRTILKRPEGVVGHHSSGGNRTEGIARPRPTAGENPLRGREDAGRSNLHDRQPEKEAAIVPRLPGGTHR